jgi:Tol biopolymer transport system component
MHKGLPIAAAVLLAFAGQGLRSAEVASAAKTRQLWSDAGANHLGTPSADGRLLSCVDTATGDLAVRELATGEMRRLTQKHPQRNKGEFAYFSAISPGNERVAYAWFNDEKFYDLRVVGMDGTESRTLFRNPEAGFVQPCAWSPDGREILTLFFRKDNISQIAMVSAEDGSVRVLKSLSWFYPKKMQVSPDGNYIIYDSLQQPGGAARDIMLLATDGSREARLVENPANDTYPLWTPDGSAVVFLSDRAGSLDAWLLPVNDGKPAGEPQPLLRGLGRVLPMAITAPGDYIFGLRTGTTDVFTASLDAKAAKLSSAPKLATPHYRGVNSAPDWSPGGKLIAFLSARGSENYGQEKRVISIRDLTSGEERDLGTRMSHIESLRWSRDGGSLMLSGSDRRGRSGLFSADVKSGRLRSLVIGEDAGFRGFEAVWSADGERIFYLDGQRVVIHDLESGNEALLHSNAAELYYPALSPDGNQLAFASKLGKVFAVPVDRGPLLELPPSFEVPVPQKGYLTGLAWSRDGRRLLMTVGQENRETLWLVPVDGGLARKIEMPEGFRRGVRTNPHSDGLAFVIGAPKNEIWSLEDILSYRRAPAE